MISTFPSKLRHFKTLSSWTKSLNKYSYSCVEKNLHKPYTDHITCTGESARCFSITNQTNTLSKTMSGEGDRELNLDYEDILKAQKDNNVLIIDVREDAEIQETGKLPGSIHVPMGEVSNLLVNLSDESFEKKYGRKKPAHDTKIILSCRSGRRSAMVQSDLQKLGYKNAYNYIGGWLDWEEKEKNKGL